MKTKNIWEYVTYKVDNKGIFSRVAHSGRFHGLRSAVSSPGSAASKALGALTAVGRASFALIPIPVIGSLLSAAESAVEGKVRAYLHKHKKHLHTKGSAEWVKFSLKEVSVADLDRYRFKVEHAVAECNTALTNWQSIKSAADKNQSRCDAKVEIAMAIAQANRRMEIFDKTVFELEELMKLSRQWSESLRTGLTQRILDIEQEFKTLHDAEADSIRANTSQPTYIVDHYHAHCGDFCVHREGGSIKRTRDSILRTLAEVTREVTDPISNDTLLSLNRSSFKSEDQLPNYSGKE